MASTVSSKLVAKLGVRQALQEGVDLYHRGLTSGGVTLGDLLRKKLEDAVRVKDEVQDSSYEEMAPECPPAECDQGEESIGVQDAFFLSSEPSRNVVPRHPLTKVKREALGEDGHQGVAGSSTQGVRAVKHEKACQKGRKPEWWLTREWAEALNELENSWEQVPASAGACSSGSDGSGGRDDSTCTYDIHANASVAEERNEWSAAKGRKSEKSASRTALGAWHAKGKTMRDRAPHLAKGKSSVWWGWRWEERPQWVDRLSRPPHRALGSESDCAGVCEPGDLAEPCDAGPGALAAPVTVPQADDGSEVEARTHSMPVPLEGCIDSSPNIKEPEAPDPFDGVESLGWGFDITGSREEAEAAESVVESAGASDGEQGDDEALPFVEDTVGDIPSPERCTSADEDFHSFITALRARTASRGVEEEGHAHMPLGERAPKKARF